MRNILILIFVCSISCVIAQNSLESSISKDDVTATCVEVNLTTNFAVMTSGLITGGNSIVAVLVPAGTGVTASLCDQDIGTWTVSSTFSASDLAMAGCPVGRDIVVFANSADGAIANGMTAGEEVPFFSIDLGISECADMTSDVQVVDGSAGGLHSCLVGLGFGTNVSIDPDGNAGGQPSEGYDVPPVSAAEGTVTCDELFATAAPVELTDFRVKKKNRDANLSWVTNSEINASHFKIYRSNDGSSWDYVSTVEAAGNSTVRKDYYYSDLNAQMFADADGDVFYRLRAIDLDGSAEYSPIRSVNFDGSGMSERFTVYPNPTDGEIHVTSNNLRVYDNPILDVYNIYGQKVAKINLSHGNNGDTQKLDLRDYNLAPGTYLLEVMHNEQRISLGKIALFN